MEKKRIACVVIITAILLSLCGCNDDKNVIAAADEYAKALIAFDSDEITDLMDDADKAEEIMDELEEISGSSENMERITAAILDSMTYEIDSKSVESSKKDKSARADIIFTLVDYEGIYDDVFDDGGNIEDYIEALEDDDGKNTTEITITVIFTLKKDEWVVKDNKAKSIKEIYEFLDEIPDYDWSNFKAIGADEFEAALYSVLGIVEDDIYEVEDTYYDKSVSYSIDDQIYSLTIYNDPEDAAIEFEEMYDDFYWEFSDDWYDGTYEYYYDEEGGCGYILFNGKTGFDGAYLYGGLYLKDDTLVMVLCYDMEPMAEKSDNIKDMNAFLNEIGYPLPN